MKNMLIKSVWCLLIIVGSVVGMKSGPLFTRLSNRGQWSSESDGRVFKFTDTITHVSIFLEKDPAGKVMFGYKMENPDRFFLLSYEIESSARKFYGIYTPAVARFPAHYFNTIKEYVKTGKNKKEFLDFVAALLRTPDENIEKVLKMGE